MILKVDVNESDLYPDEDFIERLNFIQTGQAISTSEIDITTHKLLWKKSLDYFGNVAITHVPPEKIIAHVVLDPSDFEYHCGLGAQGNQAIADLKNTFNMVDCDIVNKYTRRLELLFSQGWGAVKKNILKERPSLTLELKKLGLQKSNSFIRVQGHKLRVLLEPNLLKGLVCYVCDEWQENFPIKFPVIEPSFSKLVQVPVYEN